jgi:putative DNA primase/helicase
MSEFRKIPQFPQNKKAPQRQLGGAKETKQLRLPPPVGKAKRKIADTQPVLASEEPTNANRGQGSHDVLLVIDGQSVSCSAADIESEGGWRDSIRDARKIECVTLARLATWPSNSRLLLLVCLARRQDALAIRVDNATYASVVSAVLAAIPVARDAATLNSWLALAIEAVAAEFGDQGEIALGQVRAAFAQRGIKDLRTGDLRRRLKFILDSVKRPATERRVEARPLPAEYAEAIAVENLVVPPGWEFGEDGLRFPSSQGGCKHEFPAVVVITSVSESSGSNGEVWLEIKWRDRDSWRKIVVERKVVASARTIVDLAAQGLPVTSNNAPSLVQFLNDFELANAETLPRSCGSSHFGWHRVDKVDGFLLGNRYLVAKAQADHTKPVVYRGVDEGDQQLVHCFGTRGKLKEWRRILKSLENFPKARLVLYAAFATVLMRLVGATNFLLEIVAPTTMGKTIALRIGASAWGNPDESSPNAYLRTFDGTRTWFERIAGVMHDVPLTLDETQHIEVELADTLIYDLAQGRGKGRGTIKGLAKQATSRTITILSGEQPIVSTTKSGGAAVRVLSLTGSPFGEVSPAMADVVRNLNQGVKENYGFAGPRFVRWVLENIERQNEWRRRFQELVRYYEQRSPDGNAYAIRIAPHLALLDFTAELVHQAGILPWEFSDPIAPVYGDIIASLHAADSPKRALRFAIEWATSHQAEFYCRRGDASTAPPSGWMGRWDRSVADSEDRIVPGPAGQYADRDWDSLAFLPLRLEKLLKENGFDFAAVLPVWEERGWIISTGEKNQKRYRKRCRIGNESMWTIAIPRSVISEIRNE